LFKFVNNKARKLKGAIELIGGIDEAGELKERDGHTVVAMVVGRFFQAHHLGPGLDV